MLHQSSLLKIVQIFIQANSLDKILSSHCTKLAADVAPISPNMCNTQHCVLHNQTHKHARHCLDGAADVH